MHMRLSTLYLGNIQGGNGLHYSHKSYLHSLKLS